MAFAPKLSAMLLGGISVIMFIAYLASILGGNSGLSSLFSGLFTFSVLLLSGYIGFAGHRNLDLRPFPCFLNGAFISGTAFLVLLIGVSLATVAMGNSLSLEVTMLVPVLIMALAGGICGLAGWFVARMLDKGDKSPAPEGIAA